MSRAAVRVLLVDDSATLRGALRSLLALHPAIEIVGEAADGASAIELARGLRPDVVTMDVVMPGLDGLAATAAIMAQAPTRIVIVCDTGRTSQTDLTFHAIAAGALDVVSKPATADAEELRRFGLRLAETIRLMADVPVIGRRRATLGAATPLLHATEVAILGIVASTGGPPAITEILQRLPRELPFPIVLAQHVAPGFTIGLARWLGDCTKLTVRIAEDGRSCQAGTVYLAPDGHHIEIAEQGMLRLTPQPDGFCPSGDRLLESLASSFDARAAGMVLTGMGMDGAKGLLAIRRAGGLTMVQTPASCVVGGMPAAAIELGASDTVLSVEELGLAVRSLGRRAH